MAVQIEKTESGWIISRFFWSLPAAMKGVSELESIREVAFNTEPQEAPLLSPEAEALLSRADSAEVD